MGEVGDERLKKKMEMRVATCVWAAVDGREKRRRGIEIGLGFRLLGLGSSKIGLGF